MMDANNFFQKYRDNFIKTHGVTSQNAEVFLVTSVTPPKSHFIRFSFLPFFVTFYTSSRLPPSFFGLLFILLLAIVLSLVSHLYLFSLF